MKHVPNRFPITRKMVPVFNLIQKYKRKLNKARKHIYFYRLVLKTREFNKQVQIYLICS